MSSETTECMAHDCRIKTTWRDSLSRPRCVAHGGLPSEGSTFKATLRELVAIRYTCLGCGKLILAAEKSPEQLCVVCRENPTAHATVPTGFVKHDAEKVRYELVPAHALEQVAKVFTFGARKYADENYLKGTNWRRYVGAALRHLHAWARGEDSDPETGASHLAHMVCCGLMLMELVRVGTGTDDRVKAVTP